MAGRNRAGRLASAPRNRAAFRHKISFFGNIGAAAAVEAAKEVPRMNSVIYLIGLVVVVLAILSFLGFS
jgi:hypothetical protein